MARAAVNVEKPIEQGLRNLWYPIATSEQVGSTPLGVKALGEELVLWRDARGEVHAMEDRCPHRDTKLSLGEVVDGALTCAYHGFQYDGTGQCIAVPSEGGDCPLARRLRVPSYPTQERVGLVFGYVGDVELFPPPALEIAAELEEPEWSGFICQATWRANWLRIFDNLADPMHGPFLHGRSYTLSRGKRADRLRLSELPDGGFLIEREGQRGVNFDWVELHQTGSIWCRLDIPYPWSAGPGDPLRIVGWVTPLDADSSTVYFLRYRRLSGWKRALWRGLYKLYLERNHWAVLEQDRVAMEAQRGIESRVHEHLAPTDVGTIRLRRLFQQELARQRDVYARAGHANGHAPTVAPADAPVESASLAV
ncbi:MAG TPA: aromatic ring-hydroxylating dioxygenase subunit alpha [Chloroflexota bacterium]|jgi:phenylpropionate dioxygenase-like ring-hydroxylating dioxygenase large terminal subunit